MDIETVHQFINTWLFTFNLTYRQTLTWWTHHSPKAYRRSSDMCPPEGDWKTAETYCQQMNWPAMGKESHISAEESVASASDFGPFSGVSGFPTCPRPATWILSFRASWPSLLLWTSSRNRASCGVCTHELCFSCTAHAHTPPLLC